MAEPASRSSLAGLTFDNRGLTYMRTIFFLALVATSIGCTKARGTPHTDSTVAERIAPEFDICSMNSRYGIRGRIVGTVSADSGRMDVTVTEGAVVGHGVYRNVGMSVGIGTRSGRGWRLLRMSGRRRIAQTRSRGQVIQLDTLHFVIAGINGTDPGRDWLVVEFSFADDASGRSLTTYACAAVPLTGRTDSVRAAHLATAYETAC